MQNFGVTNKEHYGMLWYFWSGQFSDQFVIASKNHWLINSRSHEKKKRITKLENWLD